MCHMPGCRFGEGLEALPGQDGVGEPARSVIGPEYQVTQCDAGLRSASRRLAGMCKNPQVDMDEPAVAELMAAAKSAKLAHQVPLHNVG